jgi:mersacidin/lichenicidin family type 2 lantibiotic
MTTEQIVRAWREPDFWDALAADERASVPENPAGLVELFDAQLEKIVGGFHGSTHAGTQCNSTAISACQTCWTGSICCY